MAEQPRVKRRRINYDDATVLTNEYGFTLHSILITPNHSFLAAVLDDMFYAKFRFMKKSIDDASHLKRKRKGAPSFLGVWKLNNTYKKEKVFFDPLITG